MKTKIYTFLFIAGSLLNTSIVNAQVRSIRVDSSFGNSGLVISTLNTSFVNTPSGMDVQTDGKIVQGIKGTQFPAVRRFLADGTLDVSFGVNGYAVLPAALQGPTVKVLSDGSILACCGPVSNYGCYIAKLTSAGVIDPTFGTNGYVTFGNQVHPDWGFANMDPDIRVLSDNTIRLVFTNFGLQNDTAMIIKLNSDGIVDNSFGTAGKLTINQTVWTACSFMLDHNDRIVMTTQTPSGYVLVTRILPNGSIDNTFGTSGSSMIHPDPTQTTSLGLISVIGVGLPDNSTTILLNYASGSRFSFAIHVKADGTQDMSYGVNGLAAINLFISTSMTGGLALDNGEVLITGENNTVSTFQTYAGQLAMLTTAGKSDSVFANHMPFTYFQYDPNASGNQFTNVGPMILLPGNKILQAGSTQQIYTWLSRYNYTGFGVGIAEAREAVDFSIYPDPANDHAVINYQAGGNDAVNLQVFDQTGKTIFEKVLSSRSNAFQLELSGWSEGIYFVELRAGSRVSSKKMVIVR